MILLTSAFAVFKLNSIYSLELISYDVVFF